MNEFLASLKADLVDRRLLPVVALVCVALVAALAYALLGGSSGSAPATSASSIAPSSTPAGVAVTATSPDTAVAETTDGASEQHGGKSRNPFTEFSGKAAATTSATTTSSSSSSNSSSSGGSSSPTGGSEATKSTPTPSKSTPTKSTAKPVYDVVVKFGVIPPGATDETATLQTYHSLKLQMPLPSSKEALIVFRGVTDKGAAATFTLVGEAILHGPGSCLPNATQCEVVDLAPGEPEQLEYLKANGETYAYALEVVSITKLTASTASAAQRGWAESKAGVALLRHSGLMGLPYLHYSSQPGTLVFTWSKAFASRAHIAQRLHRP